MTGRTILLAAAAAVLTGCNTLERMQTCRFVDDFGNFVTVDYLRAEKEHTSTFVSPYNDKELEFKSRLKVKVELPDGETFSAWQTMNPLRVGTMYRSGDGAWQFCASGISCQVWTLTDDRSDYFLCYEGVICESPKGK